MFKCKVQLPNIWITQTLYLFIILTLKSVHDNELLWIPKFFSLCLNIWENDSFKKVDTFLVIWLMFWILDAMEEFVDNFYSYDFAGNLVSEKDESESEMDFDIVNLEQKGSRVTSSTTTTIMTIAMMSLKWTYQPWRLIYQKKYKLR